MRLDDKRIRTVHYDANLGEFFKVLLDVVTQVSMGESYNDNFALKHG